MLSQCVRAVSQHLNVGRDLVLPRHRCSSTLESCSRVLGFIVTHLATDSRAVVRFYNKQGTAEQWIKEGNQAVKMTRLSLPPVPVQRGALWLSVIAYNLGNLAPRIEGSLSLRTVSYDSGLETDLDSVNRAFAGGEWKTAVIFFSPPSS